MTASPKWDINVYDSEECGDGIAGLTVAVYVWVDSSPRADDCRAVLRFRNVPDMEDVPLDDWTDEEDYLTDRSWEIEGIPFGPDPYAPWVREAIAKAIAMAETSERMAPGNEGTIIEWED